MSGHIISTISFTKRARRDSSPADVAGYKFMIRGRIHKKEVTEPDAETVKRLNEIAGKSPFSTYARNKKYDPL